MRYEYGDGYGTRFGVARVAVAIRVEVVRILELDLNSKVKDVVEQFGWKFVNDATAVGGWSRVLRFRWVGIILTGTTLIPKHTR